jgi:hypothetical protein
MLKVEELIESLTLETLIRGVNEHAIWRKLYALPKKKKKLAQYEAIHKKSHMDERGASLL